ncbi:hypothetical protein RND71_019600 [Anisodus tanguticus]|uniref:Cytochrome P450 n=1 Tax=Anisodus tanguticus TaxID=243964 RepID=A0AAE1S0U7_9SOLA|nr:hypothetical protein RND71_019600 [Anisodus tanguticus]
MDEFLQGLIDEYRGAKNQNTMIDHLLCLQETQPEYYTDEIIKGIIMVIVSRGTDTTSVTMEWAMTLLVNHSEVLKKARTELDNHVGSDQLVNEEDLPKGGDDSSTRRNLFVRCFDTCLLFISAQIVTELEVLLRSVRNFFKSIYFDNENESLSSLPNYLTGVVVSSTPVIVPRDGSKIQLSYYSSN